MRALIILTLSQNFLKISGCENFFENLVPRLNARVQNAFGSPKLQILILRSDEME